MPAGTRTSRIADVLVPFVCVAVLCGAIGVLATSAWRHDAASASDGGTTATATDSASAAGVAVPDAARPDGAVNDAAALDDDAAIPKLPLTYAERHDLALFLRRLDEGRKATKEKRWHDAEAAFENAISVRPADARARAERGYARLMSGNLEGAAEDFERALAKGVDAKLGGQIYFNMGLLREKQKLAEGARAAFAMSNALAPSEAAKAKLGAGSSCVADIEEHPLPGEDLLSVASFDELYDAIRPLKDLGDKKKSVCIRSHNAMGEPDEQDVCTGPGIWGLVHHHFWFTEDDYFVVAQTPGPAMVYWTARVGSWPAHCTNLPSPEPSLDGNILRVTSTFDGRQATLDEGKPVEDNGQMPCADVLGYTEDVFYDVTTAKRVLRIYLPSGVAGPRITLQAGKVAVVGAGCDRTLSLGAEKQKHL